MAPNHARLPPMPPSTIHSMTMRRLLLFRHAKAERAEPGHGGPCTPADRARPQGCRQDRRLYGDPRPDARPRVVSPAPRTQETWKFARCAFKPAPGSHAGGASSTTPRRTTSSASSRTRPPPPIRLLIVGHNPGLHELALMLIASGDIETRERLREKLPTSRPGHHRFRLRRLGQAASAIRPAGALRHPQVAGSRARIEAITRTQRAHENMS